MKNQITMSREIREQLVAGPCDVLQTEAVGDSVLVRSTSPAFLSREGRIRVGFGDPVEDVRKARKLMGIRSDEAASSFDANVLPGST